ncbi:MAG: hypothetical protein ACM3Q2_04800 [Syntrophothermus sp.]
MPKNVDPHGTIKNNNRWAEKGSGSTKAGDADARQKKVLEKAREIAKNKKLKKD